MALTRIRKFKVGTVDHSVVSFYDDERYVDDKMYATFSRKTDNWGEVEIEFNDAAGTSSVVLPAWVLEVAANIKPWDKEETFNG